MALIDIATAAVAAQGSRLRDGGLDVRGASADATDMRRLDLAIDAAPNSYGRLDVAFANGDVITVKFMP